MSFRSLRVYRDNKSVTFAELDVFDLSEALSAPDVISIKTQRAVMQLPVINTTYQRGKR